MIQLTQLERSLRQGYISKNIDAKAELLPQILTNNPEETKVKLFRLDCKKYK